MKLLIKIFVLTLFLWTGPLTVEAQKRAGEYTVEPFTFAWEGQAVAAESWRLWVPENRSKPGSKLIELAFVKYKSTAQQPRSPIIYLAGGPGGSGIAAAAGARLPLFMAMREVGDVIALDQRGTGMSRPLLGCIQTWDFPLGVAHDESDRLRNARERYRACAAYWKTRGNDVAAYNTVESADDLEDIRKALRAEKISLWAISYGTHLGLAAIRRHEKNIDRAILAGVVGPNHVLKLPGNIQKGVIEIGRLVKRDAGLREKIPDLLSLMRRVLDSLDRQPVAVTLDDPQTGQKTRVVIGKWDIQVLTVLSLEKRQTISQVPALYYAMSKGDFSVPAKQLLGLSRGNIFSAMNILMECASGVSPDRWARIKREERQTLLGRALDFPQPQICDIWGSPDLGADFRAPVTSTVPVLFISGTIDTRTPVSNAQEVQKGFPNSRHLIIEGAGHDDDLLLSSLKIKETMLAFMKGGPFSTAKVFLPPIEFRR